MARTFGRLMVSAWDDPDWLSLTVNQQQVYMSMFSSRDVSWCGVLPLVPARLARTAKDMTEAKFRAALGVLEAHRFVLVDTGTAEILVRTFVRHDQILKQPNVTKAMVKALDKVHSPRLSEQVRVELARALEDDGELRGWAEVRLMAPELFADLVERASRKGSPKGSVKAFPNRSEKAS